MGGSGVFVYFNTSIMIRAAEPMHPHNVNAVNFIEEIIDYGLIPVVSNILFMEKLKPETRRGINLVMDRYGFHLIEVNAEKYLEAAVQWIREMNEVRKKGKNPISEKRTFDVAHMMVARDYGCKYIAAIDRFMWRNAKRFNLIYINYYTGVPGR